MAQEEGQIVELRDQFYRDSVGKFFAIMLGILIAIAALVALSIYLYLDKPAPVNFAADNEWRVQAEVPVNQPYLTTPDLLQWVSNTLQKVFVLDFLNYNAQLNTVMQYFTPDGAKVLANQMNIYANYNNLLANKQFIIGVAAGAPYIVNQGLIAGKYGWWVQMPITLHYYGIYNRYYRQTLTLQVLVVRVSTLNNLNGVAIDNLIVAKNTGVNG